MSAPRTASNGRTLPRSRRERACTQCGKPFCAGRGVDFCTTGCGDAWRAEQRAKVRGSLSRFQRAQRRAVIERARTTDAKKQRRTDV